MLPVTDTFKPSCEAALESDVGSYITEEHASVTENEDTVHVSNLSSNLPVNDNECTSVDDSCLNTISTAHISVQDTEESCVVSEIAAEPECIVHEDVDDGLMCSDEAAGLILSDDTAAAVSELCTDIAEPQTQSGEILGFMSSGDQQEVAPVDDSDQVSESVVDEHGDVAEDNLPASEDVACDDDVADDDGDDFEIDIL